MLVDVASFARSKIGEGPLGATLHALIPTDRPPLDLPGYCPRGELDQALVGDLRSRGVAVIQGPAGSGTSWLGSAVAAAWQGPVGWARAGLWHHLFDLVRPAWDRAPEALLRAPSEAAVEATLERLRGGGLLIIDDCDAALRPAPSPAEALDPELGLLVAALEAGELADSGGAVLFCGRRAPAGLHAAVRPLPPLSEAEGAAIAGRAVPTSWLRRPGLLTLRPGEGELPENAGDAWRLAVEGATAGLGRNTMEVLLSLAVAGHPAPPWALAEATGQRIEILDSALVELESLGLATRIEGSWRCARSVAAEARRLAPSRLPGVLARGTIQRLAAFWLRQGQDLQRAWGSIDEAMPSRLGLRLCAAADDGRMAVQAALYAGTAEQLDALGALRPLCSDLQVVLSAADEGLPKRDRARAAYARARAATRLGDAPQAQRALEIALDAANEAEEPDPSLLRAIHVDLARQLILAGDPRKALPTLDRARVLDRSPKASLEVELLRGATLLRLERLEAADAAFEAALRHAETSQDGRGRLRSLEGLAAIRFRRGKLAEAEEALVELLAQPPGTGLHRSLNPAQVRLGRGDTRGARTLLDDISEARIEAADPRSASRILSLRSRLLRTSGDLVGAAAALEAARSRVGPSGDRDSSTDFATAQAGLHRSRGEWAESAAALKRAVDAESPVDLAAVAGRSLDHAHAVAWKAAAQGNAAEVDACARACEDQLAKVPKEPFRPRWLGARLRSAEVELLLATLAGTPPLGLLRLLDLLREELAEDAQRNCPGEPSVTALLAWATRLSGRDARPLAEQAIRDAEAQGLAGLAEMTRVIAGEPTGGWHAPAELLRGLW